MARITFMQAINEALAQELERDPTVVVFGEDNAGGAGLRARTTLGARHGPTKGLYKYPGRVLDTPISESAFIGAAAGAACSGPQARSGVDVRGLLRGLYGPDL